MVIILCAVVYFTVGFVVVLRVVRRLERDQPAGCTSAWTCRAAWI